MIKPSTPTPPHLKSYQLSLIDQLLSFSEYSSPLAFFYTAPRRCSCRCCNNSNNNNDDESTSICPCRCCICNSSNDKGTSVCPCRRCCNSSNDKDEGTSIFIARLKESLSETLAIYYPLAGRVIPQDSIINCNDQGVPLVVARANCTLLSFLTATNRVDLVPQFVPRGEIFLDPTRIEVDGLIQMAFQISLFDCGGFVVGSQSITKAIDGTTWAEFLKTWAAIATTGGSPFELSGLDLNIQTRVFPPVSNSYVPPQPRIPDVLQPVADGGCLAKAFVFTPENISVLQSRAQSESVSNPTRIESVTCFLWKHMMDAAAAAATGAAFRSSSSSITRRETTAALHSVNLRAHLRPPLPPTTFGKYVTHAFADSNPKKDPSGTTTTTLSELVVSLRQALSKTKDPKWLSKFQGERRIEAALQQKKTFDEFYPAKSYFFTSLKGFDQVSFGSGDPVWIGLTSGKVSSFFRNYVPLIHTTGRRIEAWVIIDEKEMKVLESDQEFLEFATPSQNVLPFGFLPKASL